MNEIKLIQQSGSQGISILQPWTGIQYCQSQKWKRQFHKPRSTAFSPEWMTFGTGCQNQTAETQITASSPFMASATVGGSPHGAVISL